MPATLLLRLEGPLQSWGYRSKFKIRDSGREPSKSGVIGLLCCALGRDRNDPPTDLAKLKVHVRVDKPGKTLTDFQTAGGGSFRGRTDYYSPTSSGAKGKNPIILEKHYLMDASFLVAIEGEDGLLRALADAVQDPAWPLSLGRRSCPPASPVFAGFSEVDSYTALTDGAKPGSRLILEVDVAGPDSEVRNDVPLVWPDRLTRSYGSRFVRTEIVGAAS